jgi:2-polyprenyl-3-methyl-5-hydroxy-6-metoxy-1,4-benzoquinol methylase
MTEAEFDYQWKNLPSKAIEKNDIRIKEFLTFTGFNKPLFGHCPEIHGKKCLDAGCGNGRYTYAMLKLKAARVDSIDVSAEGVAKCKMINPYAQVKSIFDLEPNPIYDFVLCWGVLNHVEKPREGFSKIASQVKSNGGFLHVMLYHVDKQNSYEEGRRLWPNMSHDEKIVYCNKMIAKHGGELHGWWDAFNPKYNWSWHPDEISQWFEEEGFTRIKLVEKYNININGRLL